MKLVGNIKDIFSMVQDVLTVYLGSPKNPSFPEEVSSEDDSPTGVTQHPGGMKLPKTRARVSSLLLACNKLMADS